MLLLESSDHREFPEPSRTILLTKHAPATTVTDAVPIIRSSNTLFGVSSHHTLDVFFTTGSSGHMQSSMRIVFPSILVDYTISGDEFPLRVTAVTSSDDTTHTISASVSSLSVSASLLSPALASSCNSSLVGISAPLGSTNNVLHVLTIMEDDYKHESRGIRISGASSHASVLATASFSACIVSSPLMLCTLRDDTYNVAPEMTKRLFGLLGSSTKTVPTRIEQIVAVFDTSIPLPDDMQDQTDRDSFRACAVFLERGSLKKWHVASNQLTNATDLIDLPVAVDPFASTVTLGYVGPQSRDESGVLVLCWEKGIWTFTIGSLAPVKFIAHHSAHTLIPFPSFLLDSTTGDGISVAHPGMPSDAKGTLVRGSQLAVLFSSNLVDGSAQVVGAVKLEDSAILLRDNNTYAVLLSSPWLDSVFLEFRRCEQDPMQSGPSKKLAELLCEAPSGSFETGLSTRDLISVCRHFLSKFSKNSDAAVPHYGDALVRYQMDRVRRQVEYLEDLGTMCPSLVDGAIDGVTCGVLLSEEAFSILETLGLYDSLYALSRLLNSPFWQGVYFLSLLRLHDAMSIFDSLDLITYYFVIMDRLRRCGYTDIALQLATRARLECDPSFLASVGEGDREQALKIRKDADEYLYWIALKSKDALRLHSFILEFSRTTDTPEKTRDRLVAAVSHLAHSPSMTTFLHLVWSHLDSALCSVLISQNEFLPLAYSYGILHNDFHLASFATVKAAFTTPIEQASQRLLFLRLALSALQVCEAESRVTLDNPVVFYAEGESLGRVVTSKRVENEIKFTEAVEFLVANNALPRPSAVAASPSARSTGEDAEMREASGPDLSFRIGDICKTLASFGAFELALSISADSDASWRMLAEWFVETPLEQSLQEVVRLIKSFDKSNSHVGLLTVAEAILSSDQNALIPEPLLDMFESANLVEDLVRLYLSYGLVADAKRVSEEQTKIDKRDNRTGVDSWTSRARSVLHLVNASS
eukprot:ANDGO_01509.mRNA.1 hypothetical protein